MMAGIFILSLASTINAEDQIGNFIAGEEGNITNFCQSADCSYMILNSVKYPNGTTIYLNLSMNQIGQEFWINFSSSAIGKHYFITCANPLGKDLCEKDYFYNTIDGRTGSYSYLIAMFILILTFLGFGVLIYRDKQKMDDEKYWKKMTQRWMDKNYLRFSASVIWYNLKKNVYVLYYLIGLVIMISIYDITTSFNLVSVEPIFKILLTLYSWGAMFIAMILFGNVQEWIMDWKEQIEKINWGDLANGE